MRLLVEGFPYAADRVGDLAEELQAACKGVGEMAPTVGGDIENRFAPIHVDEEGYIAFRFVGDYYSSRLGERIVFLTKCALLPPTRSDAEDGSVPIYVYGNHHPLSLIAYDAADSPLSAQERLFTERLTGCVRAALEIYARSSRANPTYLIRSGGQGVGQTACLCARDFHLIFEAIIDELVADPDPKGWSEEDGWQGMGDMQRTLPDGHIMDHIYTGTSLTAPGRLTYYVGDSKYYSYGYEPGDDVVAKQYVYARCIIQLNMERSMAARHRGTWPVQLRDERTEGYDIVPNFFISPRMAGRFTLNDSTLTHHGTFHHWQRQWAGRLFDRDTLHLFHFDVDLPFVLAIYARQDRQEQAEWRQEARDYIRREILAALHGQYDFFIVRPPRPSLWARLRRCFRPWQRSGALPAARPLQEVMPPGVSISTGEGDGLLVALDRLERSVHESNAQLLTTLLRRHYRVTPLRMGDTGGEGAPPLSVSTSLGIATAVVLLGYCKREQRAEIQQQLFYCARAEWNGAPYPLPEDLEQARYLMLHDHFGNVLGCFRLVRPPRVYVGKDLNEERPSLYAAESTRYIGCWLEALDDEAQQRIGQSAMGNPVRLFSIYSKLPVTFVISDPLV